MYVLNFRFLSFLNFHFWIFIFICESATRFLTTLAGLQFRSLFQQLFIDYFLNLVVKRYNPQVHSNFTSSGFRNSWKIKFRSASVLSLPSPWQCGLPFLVILVLGFPLTTIYYFMIAQNVDFVWASWEKSWNGQIYDLGISGHMQNL